MAQIDASINSYCKKNIVKKHKNNEIKDFFYYKWMRLQDFYYYLKNWNSNKLILKNLKRGQYYEHDTIIRETIAQEYLAWWKDAEGFVEINKENFKDLDNMLDAKRWFESGRDEMLKLIDDTLDKIKYTRSFTDIFDVPANQDGTYTMEIEVTPGTKQYSDKYFKLEKRFSELDHQHLATVIRNIDHLWT